MGLDPGSADGTIGGSVPTRLLPAPGRPHPCIRLYLSALSSLEAQSVSTGGVFSFYTKDLFFSNFIPKAVLIIHLSEEKNSFVPFSFRQQLLFCKTHNMCIHTHTHTLTQTHTKWHNTPTRFGEKPLSPHRLEFNEFMFPHRIRLTRYEGESFSGEKC